MKSTLIAAKLNDANLACERELIILAHDPLFWITRISIKFGIFLDHAGFGSGRILAKYIGSATLKFPK
jgi:hypothetical protein